MRSQRQGATDDDGGMAAVADRPPKHRKRPPSTPIAGKAGPNHAASDLVRVALDEINLATFPVSVLDKKAQSSKEPLLFRDTIVHNGERIDRMWKVFPHPEKGFPGPIDDDVLMVLLELTREQGGAKKVFFSRYDLLKRLGWSINASYYRRLEESFQKLHAVRVEANNAFGDRNKKRFVNMGLTFIQEWKLNSETRGGERSSYVLWSDRIAASIHQELTRHLDASFYFDTLKSPIERRLFRYLDNNFDGRGLTLTLNVRDLAHEHIGISRHYKYISQLMQRLEPALNLFVEQGYLESWMLSGESLVLNKHEGFVERVQLALPFLSSCQKAPDAVAAEAAALERMLEERGVAASVASRLCTNEDKEHRARVRAAIEYFDAECSAGKQFANPGGFIVSLVGKGVPQRARTVRQPSRVKAEPPPASAEADGELEAEMAYETYRNQVGVRRFAALDEDERAALIALKRRELLGSANRRTFEKMPPKAFDEHVRYMIRKELAGQYADSFERWSQAGRERARRKAV
jgi:plasmid replication initiation protein